MPIARPCRTTEACLAVLVVALSLVSPALAQNAEAQGAPVREQISEDAAVAIVREQTNGKVVRVDRKTEGGALVYHIRVLSPDGRLREFRVDATTGSIR